MTIVYGFDRHGGFGVLDTERKCWRYAYPTSPASVKAKRNPRAVAKCSARRFDMDERVLALQSDALKAGTLASFDRLFSDILPIGELTR